MFAKIGFILLVLAFGLLLFLAGTLAPPAVRAPVTALFSSPGEAVKPVVPAAGVTGQAPESGSTQQPLSYESLLLKSETPAKTEFGIQLGLFTGAAAAEPLAGRARIAGYAPQALAVVDRSGAAWTLLAAGPFPSVEEAETARATLTQRLGSSLPLPVILLPKAPSPAAP